MCHVFFFLVCFFSSARRQALLKKKLQAARQKMQFYVSVHSQVAVCIHVCQESYNRQLCHMAQQQSPEAQYQQNQ